MVLGAVARQIAAKKIKDKVRDRKKKEPPVIQQDFLQQQGIGQQTQPDFLSTLQSKDITKATPIETQEYQPPPEFKEYIKDGKKFVVPVKEFEALEAQGDTGETEHVAAQQKKRFDEALARELGDLKLTGNVELDAISREQAYKSALADAGIGLAGGIAAGAVAGAVAGAGVGAVPGAAVVGTIGAIAGFIRGYKSNLKEQRQDIIKGEAQNLMKNEQNLLKVVMLANRVEDPDQLIELRTLFDEGMSNMDMDYARLTMETNRDATLWLGQDGHKQLEKYITFNQAGGMRDILVFQMNQALTNPNPANDATLMAQLTASESASAALEAE